MRIGTQYMFGRENIDKLSLYTEGNQGKLWQIDQQSPNLPKFYRQIRLSFLL